MKIKRRMKKCIAMFLAATMLMMINPTSYAEGLINQYPTVEALNLAYNEFQWIFVAPNFKQMFYVGTRQTGNEERQQIEAELKNIGAIKYLGPGKAFAGDVIIRTEGNECYSYYLELPSVLNINGKRFRVSLEQAQHIKNIVKIIEVNEYIDRYPQWFARMNPSNVTSFSHFQPLIPHKDFKQENFYSYEDGRDSFPPELEFMPYEFFRYYFDIEKGERYELGSEKLPKDQDYYEMNIGFRNGTSYKVMTHGNTMLIETSDMPYGCKYTLKTKSKQTSIRTAYTHRTYRWAHPLVM